MCISIVMIIYSLQRIREHRRLSIYTILIIGVALLLAFAGLFQNLSQHIWKSIPLTTIFGFVGYTLRPVCLYFFLLMSYKKPSRTFLTFSWIPLAINFVIFCLAFIPATKDYVFSYFEKNGVISFGGGYLRFTSHIISLGYLVWLLYSSMSLLKAKHINHAIVIIVCATFVVVSVVIETFFNSSGEIHLLNSTIAVSSMTYYLFLYIEKSQVDTLTGLFNRETYYVDLPKMEKTLTGVIQFDMNGLKYINDNFGHMEGDEAIATIANCIMKSSKGNMYAYRIGGDEFLVLANKKSEEEIISSVEKFKNMINKTKYHCSVGYAYKKDKTISSTELLKEAESKMYLDKEEFYKNADFERSKI